MSLLDRLTAKKAARRRASWHAASASEHVPITDDMIDVVRKALAETEDPGPVGPEAHAPPAAVIKGVKITINIDEDGSVQLDADDSTVETA